MGSKATRLNMTGTVGKIFHELFGKEAKAINGKQPLYITVLKQDGIGAKRKDPFGCKFAKACKRVFGSPIVAVWKTVVYLKRLDKNGKWIVERYIPEPKLYREISKYDRTKRMDDDCTYVLNPPSPSRTWEYRHLRNRENECHSRKISKEIKLDGKRIRVDSEGKRTARGKEASPQFNPWVPDISVRNGSGQIHFVRVRRFLSKN